MYLLFVMLCLVRYSFTSLSPNEVAVFLATLWHNRQLTVRNEYPVPLLFCTALHYVWLERFRVHLWHHRSYCARPFNSVLFDIMTDYLLFNPKYHQRDPLPQNDMPRLKLPRGQSISKLHSTSSRSIRFESAALLQQQQQQTRKTPSVLRLPQRNKLYLRMSDEVYFWKPIKLDRCSTGHVNVQRLPKGPWI